MEDVCKGVMEDKVAQHGHSFLRHLKTGCINYLVIKTDTKTYLTNLTKVSNQTKEDRKFWISF